MTYTNNNFICFAEASSSKDLFTCFRTSKSHLYPDIYRRLGCKAQLDGNQLIFTDGYCEFKFVVLIADEVYDHVLYVKDKNQNRAFNILGNIAKMQTLRLVRQTNVGF